MKFVGMRNTRIAYFAAGAVTLIVLASLLFGFGGEVDYEGIVNSVTDTELWGSPAAQVVRGVPPVAASASSKSFKAGGAAPEKGSCGKDHKFVVVIDAGSSGSRVHIYEFDVCSELPTLVHENFEMLKPGLSSYDTDVEAAAASLQPLLQKAVDAVPASARSCTPITVKATAGLRLLGDEKASAILAGVRQYIDTNFPFPIVNGEDGVGVMSGSDEGVYAWITTNYLLGNIGTTKKIPTSAVFDLGGGSTQIVFEPTFQPNEKMVDGEHKYEFEFMGNKHTLYQFSHLGYGLHQARDAVKRLLLNQAIKENKIVRGDTITNHKIINPCLPSEYVAEAEAVLLDESSYTVSFVGPRIPSPLQCRYLSEGILNKDEECAQKPCSFNGVHQPSLSRTFKEHQDMYVFSFFFDRTQKLGLPETFTLKQLRNLAKTVCSGVAVWEQTYSGIPQVLEELRADPNYCQDLSYQVSLLQSGYDIPSSRSLKTAENLSGIEIGWCLGAALPLIQQKDWTCKLEQTA